MNRFEKISLVANLIDGGGAVVGDPLKQQQDPAFKIFDTSSLPLTSEDITTETTKITFSGGYKIITGSNTVISHDDNIIDGDLFVSKNLRTGVQISGRDNAMVRSVGYEGFISASTNKCVPGFLLFSGSVLPQYAVAAGVDKRTNYAGVGLEMHAGNNSGSFRFRADETGSFIEVISTEFFFGNPNTAYISGSGGILIISASNFFLTSGGNVIISGTIIATSGQIDGWYILTGTLFASTSGEFVGMSTAGDTRFFAGANSLTNSGSGRFNVKYDGTLTASQAYISGTVFANDGGFGGTPQNPNIKISSSGELVIKAVDGHDATFLSSKTILRYNGPANMPASGSNLVINGGFDSNLSSWYTTGSVFHYTLLSSNCAGIAGISSFYSMLTQSISLPASESYLASYYYKLTGDNNYSSSNLQVTATLGNTVIYQRTIGFVGAEEGDIDAPPGFIYTDFPINTGTGSAVFSIIFKPITFAPSAAVFIDDVSVQPYLSYTDVNALGLIVADNPSQYVQIANGQSIFKGTTIIGSTYKSSETNQRVTINDAGNNRVEIYRDYAVHPMVKMGQSVIPNTNFDGIFIKNGLINATISSSLFSEAATPYIFDINIVSASLTSSVVQVLTSQASISASNISGNVITNLRLYQATPLLFGGTLFNSVGYYYNVGVGAASVTNHYGIFSRIGSSAPGTNKYAVYGESPVAANSYAGFFSGSIAIKDGTQAAGYVLTSTDTTGIATWQPAGSGSVASASFASTASFAYLAQTASFFSGSISNAITSSFAETASFALRGGYWTQSLSNNIHRISNVAITGNLSVNDNIINSDLAYITASNIFTQDQSIRAVGATALKFIEDVSSDNFIIGYDGTTNFVIGTGNTLSTAPLLNIDFSSGHIVPSTNNVTNLGSSALRFNRLFVSSSQTDELKINKSIANAKLDVNGNAIISGTLIVSGSSSFAVIGGGFSSFGKPVATAMVDINGNTIVSGTLITSGAFQLTGSMSSSAGIYASDTVHINQGIGQLLSVPSIILGTPSSRTGFIQINDRNSSFHIDISPLDTSLIADRVITIPDLNGTLMVVDSNNVYSSSLIVSGTLTALNGAITSSVGFYGTASHAIKALTASVLLGSIETASYALTADALDGKDSTTFATTASNTFVGNQIISGTLAVQGSSAGTYDTFIPFSGDNSIYLRNPNVYIDRHLSVGTVSGNLAIGKTTATARLDVNGITTISSSLATINLYASDWNAVTQLTHYSGINGGAFYITHPVGVHLLANGNPGIAVTTTGLGVKKDTLNAALDVNGNSIITGSLTVSGSTTSSLGFYGTASHAIRALTASLLLGSVVSSSYAATASLLLGSVVSASYALTASFLQGNISSASFATNADLLDGKDSAMFAVTGSNIFTGDQTITGSLILSGTLSLTGSLSGSGGVYVAGAVEAGSSMWGKTGHGQLTSFPSIILGSPSTRTAVIRMHVIDTANYIEFEPLEDITANRSIRIPNFDGTLMVLGTNNSHTGSLIVSGSSFTSVAPTVITGSLTVTNCIVGNIFTLTDSPTIVCNATSASTFYVSSAVDRTIGTCSSGVDGQKIMFRLQNTGSGLITFSLATGSNGYRFGETITTMTATSASRTDYLGVMYNLSASRWDVIAYSKGYF